MISTYHGALHTSLCDLLKIRHPIIQAPMAGFTTPELVAEVSNAGGLGMLAAGRMSVEQVVEAIEAIQERTQGPFGVNFLLAPLEAGNRNLDTVQPFLDRFRRELNLPPGRTDLVLPQAQLTEQLEIVLAAGVPVVSFALGDPTRFVERVHRAGAKVVSMITTVVEAETVVAGGVDVVVAQGSEAGGHRSTFELGRNSEAAMIGTLALVPQVVDAVKVPVVASGGIMDGRGIVASLALGAQGVQLGTRFLMARESGAPKSYRDRLLAAGDADTLLTRVHTGRPARVLHNRFSDEFEREGPEPLAWPLQTLAAGDIYAAALDRDDADYFPLYAGQGVRLSKDMQGAMDIVEELMAEARGVLGQLAL
ncbi:nitronate monooxygenase family protein [soil metagenome]